MNIHHNHSAPWSDLVTLEPLAGRWRAARPDGKAYGLDPETLARLILRGPGERVSDHPLFQQDWSAGEVAAAREWIDNGWEHALRLYLASREIPYADREDAAGSIRRHVIRGYETGCALPSRQPVTAAIIELPRPERQDGTSADRRLRSRRTVRTFVRRPIALATLGGTLWHGLARVRRTSAQSASGDELGVLLSYGTAIEVYVAVYECQGLEPGLYHYDLSRHGLAPVDSAVDRPTVFRWLFGNHAPLTAGFTVFLAGDLLRYAWIYRHERALRNLLIDCGRVAHEICLDGLACGLQSFLTPAIRDLEFLRAARLEPERFAPLYSITMGEEAAREH